MDATKDGALSRTLSPKPIDARKRAVQVRDALVEMIREGQLMTGDKLPTEAQLAAMFGVGRSSIREAVQSLVGLGIVEMRPGRGAYVSRMSVNDLMRIINGAVQLELGAALQLHEVRAMIEISGARLAAARSTTEERARLRSAIDQYCQVGAGDDAELLVEADLLFHRTIIEATHNDMLVQLLASISGLLREHRRQYASTVERSLRDVVVEEHERILAAIEQGDPHLAALAMQAHMRDIWKQIEQTARRAGDDIEEDYTYLPMYEDKDGETVRR